MDFMPSKRSDRYLWYKNLSANVVAEAVKFGGVAADATAMKAQADAVIAKMDATEAAAGVLAAAREVEQILETANDALIRAKVRNWKTLSGWAASGSEAVLQVKGSAVNFDPNTYKPVLKVAVEADVVKATTCAPIAAAIFTPIWPSPPRPTMPTFLPLVTPQWRRGE